jgi:hypothetical protein
MDAGKAIVYQGVDVAVGNRINAAATTAITAVRPTLVDVLLAPEAGRAVAAVTGMDFDFCFVNEFHCEYSIR